MQEQRDESWSNNMIEKMLTASIREQRASRRWGIFFKFLFFSYLVIVLMMAMTPLSHGPSPSKPHVAVVRVQGVIAAGARSNAEMLHDSLEKAFRSPNASSVILDINSPGGSAVQADDIFQDIMVFRKQFPEKKIYAVISDMGTSGAYYIAAATDAIYANPSSIVGSIGVLTGGFGFNKAMADYGIQRRLFTAGKNKVRLDPFSPLKTEDVSFIKGILDDVHQTFIKRVKLGRKGRLAKSKTIFSGQAYTGRQAKPLGLIDGYGNIYSVANNVANEKVMIDYTKEESIFERIATSAKAQVESFFSSIETQATPGAVMALYR